MQYRLLLREIRSVLRARKLGIAASFSIGVGVGVLLFWVPNDVSSTDRQGLAVSKTESASDARRVQIQIPARSIAADTENTLAQLEEEERLLVQAWGSLQGIGRERP
jgi:hypothetical protein